MIRTLVYILLFQVCGLNALLGGQVHSEGVAIHRESEVSDSHAQKQKKSLAPLADVQPLSKQPGFWQRVQRVMVSPLFWGLGLGTGVIAFCKHALHKLQLPLFGHKSRALVIYHGRSADASVAPASQNRSVGTWAKGQIRTYARPERPSEVTTPELYSHALYNSYLKSKVLIGCGLRDSRGGFAFQPMLRAENLPYRYRTDIAYEEEERLHLEVCQVFSTFHRRVCVVDAVKKMRNIACYTLDPTQLEASHFTPEFLADLESLGRRAQYDVRKVKSFVSRYGVMMAFKQCYGGYDFFQKVEEGVESGPQVALDWLRGGVFDTSRVPFKALFTAGMAHGGHPSTHDLNYSMEAAAEDEWYMGVTKLEDVVRLDVLVEKLLVLPHLEGYLLRRRALAHLKAYFASDSYKRESTLGRHTDIEQLNEQRWMYPQLWNL